MNEDDELTSLWALLARDMQRAIAESLFFARQPLLVDPAGKVVATFSEASLTFRHVDDVRFPARRDRTYARLGLLENCRGRRA